MPTAKKGGSKVKRAKPKKAQGDKYLGTGIASKGAKSLKSIYKKRKARLDKI